jgi:hypothetical protein
MYLRFLGENHFASGNSLLREAVEFKPLILHLAFITNKKQWSGHIRGQAMRTIPEEEHAYIMKAAETPQGLKPLTPPRRDPPPPHQELPLSGPRSSLGDR